MGLYLSGLDGRVTQDLLDIPQVTNLTQEQRGKGVPKRMTSDTLLDTRSTSSRAASMILSPLQYTNCTINLWAPVSLCMTAVASACDSTFG